jgi:hypothetical protein
VRWREQTVSKPHGTVDECLVLIRIKRRAAKEAMRKMIVEFAVPKYGNHSLPGIETMLDYLSNMIYCIELILKMFSNDWKSHEVGKMYKTVFGKEHGDPVLMAEIKDALKDQKYLLEPKNGLLSRVEGLESLFDELKRKLFVEYSKYSVQKEIPAPSSFLPYLRDNFLRFYKATGPKRSGFPLPEELAEFQRRCDVEIQEIKGVFEKWIDAEYDFGFHFVEASTIWRDL